MSSDKEAGAASPFEGLLRDHLAYVKAARTEKERRVRERFYLDAALLVLHGRDRSPPDVAMGRDLGIPGHPWSPQRETQGRARRPDPGSVVNGGSPWDRDEAEYRAAERERLEQEAAERRRENAIPGLDDVLPEGVAA